MMIPNLLIIMPAFNASRFIQKSISSILSQSGVNIKLVVIDDASTDDTYTISKSFPNIITFRNVKNMGNYYSTNKILHTELNSNFNWDYYTFHAADDISYPTRMIQQINLFDDKTLAVGCGFQRVDFKNKRIISKNIQTIESMLIFKKEVLNIIGFRDSGRAGCDTEYKKRLLLARPNSIKSINRILMDCYLHENNLTKRIPIGGSYRKKYVAEFTKKHQLMKKNNNFYQDFKP